MKFRAYWVRFLKKNPRAENGTSLTLNAEKFRACLENSYEQGYRDGYVAAENEKSMFQRIFG